MVKTHTLKINNSHTVEISQKEAEELDVVQIYPDTFHLIHNFATYKVKFLSKDFNGKYYKVKVNETEFAIEIKTELDQLIEELGFEVGKQKQINSIIAPMPGLILKVNVSVGQEVEENDGLLILEAMKMENNLASPRSGKIKSILVKTGEAVEKGQLLIEFE